MKAGLSLVELAQEIERRANAKKDLIAPSPKIAMNDSQQLLIGDKHLVGVNTLAHSQIGEYVGIPAKYYQRMQAEAPALLAKNVNQWMQHADNSKDKRMVRMLDGKARAFLSDKYRPLENEDLANAVLPVLMEEGFMILSCEVTERRLYIKAVDRKIERDVPTGRKIGDGSHVFFDTVSPGITIKNSEVGAGALDIARSIFTKMCTNLATFDTVLRKYHTGGRASLTDEMYALLSNETRRVSDAALWGQVRDLVKHALAPDTFDVTVKKLSQAHEQPLPVEDIGDVVEVTGKKLGLIETERKGILRRLIEGGDLTRYGLHSAITRHAEDVDSYDRASELEKLGGDVIEMGNAQWQQLLKAAA